MDELEPGYLLAVCAAAVWTPRPLTSCLRALGSARELVKVARNEALAPADCEPLGLDVLARIASIDDAAARDALAAAQQDGDCFLTDKDPQYPRRLLDLCDPPPVIYYRGSLGALETKSAAIVGSRAATPYGRAIGASLASDFCAFGVSVVSGLARGIDATAHRACVDSQAPTIAVIGSGLSALYPSYHAMLAKEIVANGGLIMTEFAPRMSARPHHFPMRNRLVAALADTTVVVEASYKSGALITARLASELGRPVFAIPGDIGRPTSEGTNTLIKDGATLTTSAGDMCAVLGWPANVRTGAGPKAQGTADPILDALHRSASSCDPQELSAACGLDIAAVLAHLTMLEIQGLVERGAGGLYAAARAGKAANVHR